MVSSAKRHGKSKKTQNVASESEGVAMEIEVSGSGEKEDGGGANSSQILVEENCSSLSPQPQNAHVMPKVDQASQQFYLHTADYHFNGDKEQLRQIIKGVVKKSGFDETELAGPTAERDIHEFMDRYVDSNWRVRVDIPVKDLRKMIPLLIMYVYNMREERSHRKVKGMWTVKPSDWPEDVPYCDPNNQTRPGLGKPKKDILMKMFIFLLRKYKEAKPPTAAASPAASYASMSPVSDTDSCPVNGTDYQVIENQTPLGSAPEQYVETMETEPSTMVTMEMQEWDPSRDIMQRIQDKVHYLINSNQVPQGDVGLLSIIRDLFCKMYDVHQNAVQFFLTSAHEFECTLDLVHHYHEMTEKDRLKWKDFEGKAAHCDAPTVYTYSLDKDAPTSFVPNFIQNDAEEHVEVTQPILDSGTMNTSTSNKEGITLCHIEDLQDLDSGIQIIIEGEMLMQENPEGDKMTKEVTQFVVNGSEEEILVQSKDELNGYQYFIVGGEAQSHSLNSMAEQSFAASCENEQLHNYQNSYVINSDVSCVSDIPRECDVQVESHMEGGERESESVRLTADILSTSLAIVAQNPEAKSTNSSEVELFQNDDVNSRSPNLSTIPGNELSPGGGDLSEVVKTTSADTSGKTPYNNSTVATSSQNLFIQKDLGTLQAAKHLSLCPSTNKNFSAPACPNLVAQDLRTNKKLAEKKLGPPRDVSRKSDPQKDTGVFPNQLNRPPEKNSSKNQDLNQQAHEVNTGLINIQSQPPSSESVVPQEPGRNVQPPDISKLHIKQPANATCKTPFPAKNSKIKKKLPDKDTGQQRKNPMGLSTKSIPQLKQGNKPGGQKRLVSPGVKKLLGKHLAQRMTSTSSVISSTASVARKSNYSFVGPPGSATRLITSSKTNSRNQDNFAKTGPGDPGGSAKTSKEKEKATSPAVESEGATQGLTSEDVDPGGSRPARNDLDQDQFQNLQHSGDSEEVIPTVVEDIEVEQPEDERPRKKRSRKK